MSLLKRIEQGQGGKSSEQSSAPSQATGDGSRLASLQARRVSAPVPAINSLTGQGNWGGASSTIVSAATVSLAGMVGWVGLIIPHIARRLFGADARYMLPASMLIGATFTVLCDDLARVLLPGEIPLGILTSLIGAAIFITLMVRQNVSVQP